MAGQIKLWPTQTELFDYFMNYIATTKTADVTLNYEIQLIFMAIFCRNIRIFSLHTILFVRLHLVPWLYIARPEEGENYGGHDVGNGANNEDIVPVFNRIL
jgi:hypothetical protein